MRPFLLMIPLNGDDGSEHAYISFYVCIYMHRVITYPIHSLTPPILLFIHSSYCCSPLIFIIYYLCFYSSRNTYTSTSPSFLVSHLNLFFITDEFTLVTSKGCLHAAVGRRCGECTLEPSGLAADINDHYHACPH